MTTITGKIIWFFSDLKVAQSVVFNRNTISNINFQHAAILFDNNNVSYENGVIVNPTTISFNNDFNMFQWNKQWYGVSVLNIKYNNLFSKYGNEFLEKIGGSTTSSCPKNCRAAVDYILLKYGIQLCTRSDSETEKLNKLFNS
jgi:hypothetical protein